MIDLQPNPKIMVVDDMPANLKLLEEMLKARGCQVHPFSCGQLALAAAATEPPDLILLDINMPEMNGYEVCCQLKADAKLATIPVIFISVLSETLDKVKAFGCGGVDYVTKPFQFAEVYARVETHLKLRWLQRELERQNQQLKESYDRLREIEDLSQPQRQAGHRSVDDRLREIANISHQPRVAGSSPGAGNSAH